MRIHKRRKTPDDLAIADLDRTDLGDPVMFATPASGLDIHDHVLLPRVQRPANPHDVRAKSRGT